MRRHLLPPMVLMVPLLLMATACDAASAPADDDDDGGSSGDDGAPRGCELETRADAYALGMQKQGDGVSIAFLDAVPAPPSRGDNTWRVHVQSLAGAPLSDATLRVDPFMPDHQHGTSIATHVVALPTAGDYELSPVNLFMPGLWDVTIGVETADVADAVVFRFCVDP